MTLAIIVLALWIFVGCMNFCACEAGQPAHWSSYWLCYAVLIVCLIERVINYMA